jgi:predicted homoserine dehydrogenase-like protein
MILVDAALERRAQAGNPIRVAMVGAGFMGRGIARQIIRHVSGMRLVAIANRTIERAEAAFVEAGVPELAVVETVAQLEHAIARRRYAITADPLLCCEAAAIDAIIEVTGSIEEGARVTLSAIENGKHVILMNAELGGTLGPILKVCADRAGVVVTDSDGDQPAAILNLYRFLRGLGVRPVLCGNIKGLHDPYRNPTTQQAFAQRWGQKPRMVTSFADGTKISFEQALVANATGMSVARRGMYGFHVDGGTPIEEAARRFAADELLEGPGIVDYVVGAVPSPGVFVLGHHGDPVQRRYLELYKMGEGPLYCFHTPYHLCHFEVPNTVARAVLFSDAAITPSEPMVEVVATAKRELRAGEVLDGIGGYMVYGLAENAAPARAQRLFPIGLAEGCTLRRSIVRDQVLTVDDVDVPPGRLCDRLRAEQDTHFAPEPVAGAGASALSR